GQAYTMRADDGVELGDYRAPSGRFVQRCIRVTRAGAPTLYFRPDRNADRVEVVFENWALHATAAHLPPYAVQILRDDRKIGEARVSTKHWWGSRWRWQSAPRPLLHDRQELIRLREVQPYEAVLSLPPKMGPIPRYAPMGFAGLTPYMPTTGERGDIGPH